MNDANEKVVLVDENDNEVGTMDKLTAHHQGVLHRALSVFVFNPEGKLIIQRRALHKYHSPGKWANTCCSHPRIDEDVENAAHRRLMEEMGFDTRLNKVFSFIYKADVGEGLIEHELDHVLIGSFDGVPKVNPGEVDTWEAVEMDDLKKDVKDNPDDYAEWFKIIFERVDEFYQSKVK